MAAITSVNAAEAIVKLVAARVLPDLVGNLVMGNLVDRSFENEIQQAGDTVNVPIAPTMTANNIAEGGSIQTQNPNLGNALIVLNQHRESSFVVPDVTKLLAKPDLLATYMQPAVNAIAQAVETDILEQYLLLTQNSAIGTLGTDLNEATVDLAETVIFDAKIPQSLQRYLVTGSEDYAVLRQIPRFSESDKIGAEALGAITRGELPAIKDIIPIRSQYVDKTGGTNGICFTKPAIGLVVRALPTVLPGTGAVATFVNMGNFGMRAVMSYEHDTLAQKVTVDMLYGTAVLDSRYAVHVRS